MGILVADRKFFGEIGSLDSGMKIYGGENVELGIRVRCTHTDLFFLNLFCSYVYDKTNIYNTYS